MDEHLGAWMPIVGSPLPLHCVKLWHRAQMLCFTSACFALIVSKGRVPILAVLLQVFGPAALAAAGVTGSVKSPPKSPSEAGQAAPAPAGASSQRRSLPPQVPRLQLSAISLQQLQAQALPVLPPPVLLSPPPPAQGEQGDEPRAASQPPADPFAHVLSVADGIAVLGGSRAGAAHPGGTLGAPSPAGSVQQSCEVGLPLLSARRSVSPAQQELLATARQWQLTARSAAAEADAEEAIAAHYPPPLPSARGSARGPGPAGFASVAAAAAAPTSRGAARAGYLPRPSQTPRGQTPRPGSGGGGGLPGSTPGLRGKAGLRPTYGQDQAFLEIRAAYNAGGCV